MTTIDEETLPEVKPRNAFIAFFLSIVAPGLGQIYNGQIKKAVYFLILFSLSVIVFGLTIGIKSFYSLQAFLVIISLLRIIMIVDAIVYARKQKEYYPKKYNSWYYQTLIAISILGVLYAYSFILPSIFGIKSFKIPTASNEPTILVGDCIIADLRAYNNKTPNYGDLVIFKVKDGQFYTKRVVGLPNDTIAINNDIVSINGKSNRSTFIGEKRWENSPAGMNIKEEEFIEELPNRFKHLIYKFNIGFDSTKSNMKAAIVPSGHYFVLGDNRDNSIDSRYIGAINLNDIMGQFLYTYWGISKKRINIDLHHSL